MKMQRRGPLLAAGCLLVSVLSVAMAPVGAQSAGSSGGAPVSTSGRMIVTEDIQRIYWAVLGRGPTAAELLDAMDQGTDLSSLVTAIAEGSDFAAVLAVADNQAFVELLYPHVLGRAADSGGTSYWVARLDAGLSRAAVVVAFSQSAEFTVPVGGGDGDDATFQLDILHINDHHSHLQEDSITLDLGGLDEVSMPMGGFARVAGLIKDLEDDNPNTVKIHAGDAVTGTLYYSLFKGEADAAVMNEVCFDIFELGNHEFDDSDQGLDDFLDWLAEGSCDTSVLAANVVPAPGTPIADGYFEPYVIKDFGGVEVGFIGIDIAQKTKVSSSPLDSTEFLDEVETSQRYVDELTAMGVDRIVLVTHYQYRNDLALASLVTGVDVIIGGDSHSLLGDGFADYGFEIDGPYPTITTDGAGSPVCVAQAWQYSNIVGHLTIDFDEAGAVSSCGGVPHLLLGDTFSREVPDTSEGAEDGDTVEVELAGAERAAVLAEIDAQPFLTIVEPDPATVAIIDGFSGQVDALSAQVIGTATEDLCLARVPNDTRTQLVSCAGNTPNGGDIQQLVTEGFLARAFRSEIALQNSGGIRIDIPAGPVTIADAYTLLPFANTMVEMELTGAEIKATLEEGLINYLDEGGSSGAYPYAAGLRFDVDMTAPAGDRFSDLEVQPKGSDQWTAIDPTATYVVVTNNFMASGGDGYTTMGAKFDRGEYVDTLLDYAQTFIDYVERDLGGTIGRVAPDRYSTQTFVPAAEG